MVSLRPWQTLCLKFFVKQDRKNIFWIFLLCFTFENVSVTRLYQNNQQRIVAIAPPSRTGMTITVDSPRFATHLYHHHHHLVTPHYTQPRPLDMMESGRQLRTPCKKQRTIWTDDAPKCPFFTEILNVFPSPQIRTLLGKKWRYMIGGRGLSYSLLLSLHSKWQQNNVHVEKRGGRTSVHVHKNKRPSRISCEFFIGSIRAASSTTHHE